MMMMTESGNSLKVRKQNIYISKDTVIMCNVKVMIIIKYIYWRAWQQLRDNTGNHWRKKAH
jgi:hypothetical protein